MAAAVADAAGWLEVVLAQQRHFLSRYGDSLDQMLWGLVSFMPVEEGADDPAGLKIQAVYSLLDLFGIYRAMVMRSPEALPVVEAGPGLQGARLRYAAAAFSLRALRSAQVLLEMWALRRGGCPERALRLCARVEAAKLLLKLALRRQTPFAFYVDEAALDEAEPPSGAGAQAPLQAAPAQDAFVGRRTGRTLTALGPHAAHRGSALGVARSLGNIVADRSPGSLQTLVAEVLFHGRPFVHLMMLIQRGRRSWAAWFVAVLLDRLSLGLLTSAVRPRPNSRAAALELAELRRRRWLQAWALARSPAFELLLRRPAERLDRILKRIPIVNLFNFLELGLALQPLYSSSSAS